MREPKRRLKEKAGPKKDERDQLENELDDALENTFPASDPVAAEEPTPPAVDRGRTRTRKKS